MKVRVDGWDGEWVDANVTKAHFRAPFQAFDSFSPDDNYPDDFEDEECKVIYKVQVIVESKD